MTRKYGSRRIGRYAAIAALGYLTMAPRAASAQAITTGMVEIHITDETKAVLPGVAVTITNVDTGLTRNGVTDARGLFQFLNMPLGNNYDVKMELTGFTTQTLRKVRVDIGTQVFNVALKLGTVEESVQVAGTAPLVDTRSAATTR